jgi:hypothetical protein
MAQSVDEVAAFPIPNRPGNHDGQNDRKDYPEVIGNINDQS